MTGGAGEGEGRQPVSASASANDVKIQGGITTQRKRVCRKIKEHAAILRGTNAKKNILQDLLVLGNSIFCTFPQ